MSEAYRNAEGVAPSHGSNKDEQRDGQDSSSDEGVEGVASPVFPSGTSGAFVTKPVPLPACASGVDEMEPAPLRPSESKADEMGPSPLPSSGLEVDEVEPAPLHDPGSEQGETTEQAPGSDQASGNAKEKDSSSDEGVDDMEPASLQDFGSDQGEIQEEALESDLASPNAEEKESFRSRMDSDDSEGQTGFINFPAIDRGESNIIEPEAPRDTQSKTESCETKLRQAIKTGDIEIFKAKLSSVFDSPPRYRDESQAHADIDQEIRLWKWLLREVANSGNQEMFEAVVDHLWKSLAHDHHQLVEVIEPRDKDDEMLSRVPMDALPTFLSPLLERAIRCGNLRVFEAAMYLGRELQVHQLQELAERGEPKLFRWVFEKKKKGSMERLIHRSTSSQYKFAEKRNKELDKWCTWCAEKRELETLSSVIANSAQPSAEDLKKLSMNVARAEFTNCCLQAVTSAENPFIPGLTLSIRLGAAAKLASEGQRRTISDTQSRVDELLLEILERLPQTVRGFEGGVDGCTEVFEPKHLRSSNELGDLGGPLEMILSEQEQLKTFSKSPLVMDFLSNKFSLGLSDMIDTEGVLADDTQLHYLKDVQTGDGGRINLLLGDAVGAFLQGAGAKTPSVTLLPAEGAFLQGAEAKTPSVTLLPAVGAFLQGAGAKTPSVTLLPGAQFTVTGVIAAPAEYYRIPAVRMALDFVVYVGVIVALSYFVLFSATGSAFDAGDIADFGLVERAGALVFIMGGMYREGREMMRDIRMYFKDQWNVLDTLGILGVLVGLIIRWEDSSSPWGPAFYALSTPLIVSRVLFFAQLLQFQGPMIQVIFRMTSTLLQFVAVMLVIMVGFAAALHVLFSDVHTFGVTLLDLFNAMLGDTELFNVFRGSRYEVVATMLLVVYLFIVTIMLLNLLVAILSTSHAQVQGNLETEFKVSKARIVAYYRVVVREGLLPAPFNLVQLALSLPVYFVALIYYYSFPEAATEIDRSGREYWGDVWKSARTCQKRFREAFGTVVLWLVLGPVAVAGGAILWGLSGFSYAQYVVYDNKRKSLVKGFDKLREKLANKSRRRFLQAAIYNFCKTTDENGGTSQESMNSDENGDTSQESTSRKIRYLVRKHTIASMLRKAPGGVGADKLREYLENPMDDESVRQDEKTRPTTVEHIKQLRDRLLKKMNGHCKLNQVTELEKQISSPSLS
eukprot:g16578.t1